MILLIDNYDSFSYNLVQLFGAIGAQVTVYRNDAIAVEDVGALGPDAIVVSPGPCTPNEAGISVETIRRYSGSIPILGVCLGHQSMGVAFGAVVDRADRVMHGKTSSIRHTEAGLYRNLRNPFPAGRYHSLLVLRHTLPPELVVEATTEEDEIMGMRHVQHPTFGVQFHPESILTPSGKLLLRNFLHLADEFNAAER